MRSRRVAMRIPLWQGSVSSRKCWSARHFPSATVAVRSQPVALIRINSASRFAYDAASRGQHLFYQGLRPNWCSKGVARSCATLPTLNRSQSHQGLTIVEVLRRLDQYSMRVGASGKVFPRELSDVLDAVGPRMQLVEQGLTFLSHLHFPPSTRRGTDHFPLLRALARLGRKDQALLLLQQNSDGSASTEPRPTLSEMAAIVEGLSQGGHTQEALQLVEHDMVAKYGLQPTSSGEVLAGLLGKHVMEGDASGAQQFVELMKVQGHPVDGHVYGALISASLRKAMATPLGAAQDDLRDVFYLIDQMRAENIPLSEDIVQQVLEACNRRGSSKGALRLLNVMYPENVGTKDREYVQKALELLRESLGVCEAVADTSTALQIVARMEALGVPLMKSLPMLLSVCVRARDLTLSLMTLERGKAKQAYFAQLKDFKKLLSICKGIREVKAVLSAAQGFGLPLDLAFFNHAINSCAEDGQQSLAFEIFDMMIEEFGLTPDIWTYNTLIKACVPSGDMRTALGVLRMAEEAGGGDVATYSTLMSVCKRFNGKGEGQQREDYPSMGDGAGGGLRLLSDPVEQAFSIFDRMKEQGIEPNIVVWGALMDTCTTHKRLDSAGEVWGMMKAAGQRPTVVLCNQLIDSLAKQGEGAEAFALVNRMREEGIEPNTSTFTSLLKACIPPKKRNEELEQRAARLENADLASAAWVMHQMETSGLQPTVITFNNLIKVLLSAGNGDGPDSLEKGDDEEEDPHTRRAENRSWKDRDRRKKLKGEQLDLALEVVQQMDEYGIEPNEVTMTMLMNGCVDADRPSTLAWLLTEMKRRHIQPNSYTYSVLIHSYARSGRVEEALACFNEMKQTGVPRGIVTFNSMLHACAKAKDHNQAYSLLGEMLDQGISPDSVTINSLCQLCLLAKRPEDTELILSLLNTYSIKPDKNTYNTLLKIYADGNLVRSGYHIFRKMREEGFQPESAAVTLLLQSCLLARQAEVALPLMRDVTADKRIAVPREVFAGITRLLDDSRGYRDRRNVNQVVQALGATHKSENFTNNIPAGPSTKPTAATTPTTNNNNSSRRVQNPSQSYQATQPTQPRPQSQQQQPQPQRHQQPITPSSSASRSNTRTQFVFSLRTFWRENNLSGALESTKGYLQQSSSETKSNPLVSLLSILAEERDRIAIEKVFSLHDDATREGQPAMESLAKDLDGLVRECCARKDPITARLILTKKAGKGWLSGEEKEVAHAVLEACVPDGHVEEAMRIVKWLKKVRGVEQPDQQTLEVFVRVCASNHAFKDVIEGLAALQTVEVEQQQQQREEGTPASMLASMVKYFQSIEPATRNDKANTRKRKQKEKEQP